MDSGLSASDVALMGKNNGWGDGMAFIWIFALLILANGGFGNFGYNRTGEFGQFATAASQSEILLGQQFQGLDNKIDRIGNGIADATFSLNNSIKDGNYALDKAISDCCCTTQRNIDSVRFDMANYYAQTNANTTAQIQKVLDAICTNRMADMQNQINQLQLQSAMCGVVRYPNASTYCAGNSLFNNGQCGCTV